MNIKATLYAANELDKVAADMRHRALYGWDLPAARARNLREIALETALVYGYYDVFNDYVYTDLEAAREALRGGNPIVPILRSHTVAHP